MIEVQELFLSEEALREQHEELVDGIDKLKEIKDSVLDLHLKKLRREYLPYHTDLEEVIKCTVSNPEQFYRDVCNSLKYEERRDIILDMYDKTCENCQNHSCRLTQNEKDKMSDCKSWYNEVEIGMSKVLKR